MSTNALFLIAWAFAWLGGMFFGMQLQSKLFERGIRGKSTDGRSPKPFPVLKVKANDGTGNSGSPVVLDVDRRPDER